MLWTKILHFHNELCNKIWDQHKKKGYKTDVFSSALNSSFPLCTSACACEFVFQEFLFLCLCSGVYLESLELAVILCSVYLTVSCHILVLVLITVIVIILIDREMKRSHLLRWINCTHSSWTRWTVKWINFKRSFRTRRMLKNKNDWGRSKRKWKRRRNAKKKKRERKEKKKKTGESKYERIPHCLSNTYG